MRVECKHFVVHTFGFGKDFGLFNQPLKQRKTLFFHPFGMPLHAQEGFKLGAFHCLGHTIYSGCSKLKLAASIANGLMMERVYMHATSMENLC